jgi:hypothetical protein
MSGTGDIENSIYIEWVYGIGGVGKTYYVHEKENYNLCSMSWEDYNRMFNTYDGEEVVLFDNFDSYTGKGEEIPLNFFREMFNGKRQLRGRKLFSPKKIYFITIRKPEEDNRLFNLVLSKGGKLTEIKGENRRPPPKISFVTV